MKIQNDAGDSLAPLSGDAGVPKLPRENSPSEPAAATEQPISDTVEASEILRHIEADRARLERLRKAVRDGTYVVPAAEVSARIVDDHLNKST